MYCAYFIRSCFSITIFLQKPNTILADLITLAVILKAAGALAVAAFVVPPLSLYCLIFACATNKMHHTRKHMSTQCTEATHLHQRTYYIYQQCSATSCYLCSPILGWKARGLRSRQALMALDLASSCSTLL